jgi:Family of unknown function (DUF6252)
MKYIVTLVFLFVFISCRKENSKVFKPYFNLKVNGNKTALNSCSFFEGGGGEFSCSISGDSILLISVGCEAKTGFFIKGQPTNSTYILDNVNRAWYEENSIKKYGTNVLQKGSLTIEKGIFQAVETINTLKGSFSFNAIDTATGHIVNITNGEFLMKLSTY